MFQKNHLSLIFWILLALGLLLVLQESPAMANLGGSNVTFEPSVEYETGKFSGSCYIPGRSKKLCFNFDTYSPDGQDASTLAIQFPSDWDVYGNWVGDHYDYSSIEYNCDNGGTMNSSLYWSGFARDGQYWAEDNRVQNVGTTCHALYCFWVSDGTDPGNPPYNEQDASVSWSWLGPPDSTSSPYSVCSDDGVYPQDGFPCELETGVAATVPVCQYENIEILPATLPRGVAGQFYNQQLSPTNPDPSNPVYSYSYTSGMPAGFNLFTNTGEIKWYGPEAGTYTFTVMVTGPDWSDGSREYTIIIDPLLIFDPEELPIARQNSPYDQPITVTEGAAPYTLTLESGTLPAGLSFTDGSFVGTPTETGVFEDLVVRALDDNGIENTHTYSLTVYPEHLFTWTPTVPASAENVTLTGEAGFDYYRWSYASEAGGECDQTIWNFSQVITIQLYGKGDHKVCLELTDYTPTFVYITDEQWITVLNGPPTVEGAWTYPTPSFPNQPFTTQSYFYDYDGGGFTCEVDWGDGTTETVTNEDWYCYFSTHSYDAVGTYDINFKVTDDEDLFGEYSIQHEVVTIYGEGGQTNLASNVLPTRILLNAFAPLGTESLEFTISTDPEHGTMSTPEFISCSTYRWTPTMERCQGKVIFSPTITDPPNVGYDDYEFTVSDVYGHTSEPKQNSLYLEENEPSTAKDGEAVINAVEPSQFAIFAVDMDAYDYNYDELTFHIDTLPQHGTLQFEGNPDVFDWIYDEGGYDLIGVEWSQLITYLPNPGNTASTDSFTFHVDDSHQDSNVAAESLTFHTPVLLHVNVNDDIVDAQGCDDTHCSLREAIAAAQVGDSIDFTLPLPNTITLTEESGGELLVNKFISIVGPGPDLLSISAGFSDPEMNPWNGFRVFHVFNDYWPLEVSISGLTIRDGRMDKGGGILVGQVAELNLWDCQIGPNNIVATAGGGLAIDDAVVTMENCSVVGNEGTGTLGGAGIIVETYGTLTAINSTISGNITNNLGGGLLAYNNSEVTLIHTTVSGNLANENYLEEPWGGGGGVYSDQSTITLYNSIIAGNTDMTDPGKHAKWPDVKGTVISLGGNLIGDGSGSSGWLASDRVGTAAGPIDPLLGDLGVVEPGSTVTYPLLAGSPALDSAICLPSVKFDQRGVKRPQGLSCDIGSFELESNQTYQFLPVILR